MEWQLIQTLPSGLEAWHLRGLWVYDAATGRPKYWQADFGMITDQGTFEGVDGDFGWSPDDYTHWCPAPPPPAPEGEV